MKQTLRTSLVFIASTLSASFAQEAPESASDDFSNVIVVIGEAQNDSAFVAAPELAGSQDIITRDELAYEHPDDTLELFTKIPGVNIARYNQGLINTDIGIRGFGTDGVTPHAKLLIDGIPANLHNGYNELDQMFPLAIGSIEVFKGTSDARYGRYNVAGSYNVSSRTDLGNELQVTVDSFGGYELQGYTGSKDGNLTENYFLGYRKSQGYRDHNALDKYTFSGRWAYEVDDSFTYGAFARFSSYKGDAPGYLTQEEAEANPTSSADYTSDDSGEKTVNHFSAFADKEFLNGDLQLSLKAYYNDIFRERFVRFAEGWDLRHRIDNQDIGGFIATSNWFINDHFSLKTGLDYQHQDVTEEDYQTPGVGGDYNVNRVRKQHNYTLENIGGFVSFEYDSHSAFRGNIGLRLDRVSGKGTFGAGVTNPATGERDLVQTSDAEASYDSVLQPKVNLFYDINDAVTAFANYGRTFQTPFSSNFYNAEELNINDGGELGFSYQFTDQSNFRLSVWNQKAENEYQLHPYNGTYEEIGEIDRRGIEFAFDHQVNSAVTIWGNYGYTKSEIKEAINTVSFADTKGNEVRSTPNHTYSLGLSYQVNDALSTRLHFDGQGDYYINEANTGGRFGDYNIINAGVDYQTSFGLFSVQINNIFDSYYEYVFDFSGPTTDATTIHSPGDGRNASISYTYSF